MCETCSPTMMVMCSSLKKPCLYKPQTVPICPFSSCCICQPKPQKCCCINTMCTQASVPPPFPFEGDPCPMAPSNMCGQTKSFPCLQRNVKCTPTSFLKMLEVQPVGRYVKIFNSSYNKSVCVEGWYLIQFCCGSPLSVFKFPENAYIPPQYRVKIWSKCSDPGWLKLPTDYTFHELCFWKAGPGITSVLYTPQGTPVTWLCGLEKFEPAQCYICDPSLSFKSPTIVPVCN